MDTGAKPTAFNLMDYKVVRFSLEDYRGPNKGLSLEFNPSGNLDLKNQNFLLTLGIKATVDMEQDDDESHELLSAELVASFHFDDPVTLEILPEYFYSNSIAIVFPFLRAFIITLTQQANIKRILLPLFNFTGMEDKLRQNSTES